ncbi:MAG: hypothetical protein Hyperionvirus3_38 [Hyperionvirus sp.]|uniref:Sel1 repeat family protein n=1 Tax=Hyperionvirus sp. TaxID=2487770 RepID=A0A3G5A775_9VIRU|nr:MAG: hypothetical protein Hyperionvirus3_38 [Hyperionvirus sp.]
MASIVSDADAKRNFFDETIMRFKIDCNKEKITTEIINSVYELFKNNVIADIDIKADNEIFFVMCGTYYNEKNDHENELKWFTLATEFGNTYGMYKIGDYYQYIKQDNKTAVEYYDRAAQFDNTIALNKLAECYKYGKGVKKDDDEALRLYEYSAGLGNTNAMVHVAHSYMQAANQNMPRAIELYQTASELDNVYALYHLASCYVSAIGVIADKYKARQLYQRCMYLGDVPGGLASKKLLKT